MSCPLVALMTFHSRQAEALASENRLLRGVNAEQEESIERLERENAALREDTRIRQAERRRMAERVSVERACSGKMVV